MLDLLRYSPNPDLGADARACFFDALNEANTYDIAQTQSQFAAMTPANSMSFEDMTIRLFAHERILNVIEKKAGLRGYENRPLHHFVLEADLHHSMYVNFMRVHQVLLGHPSRAGIDSTLQRAIRLDELAIIIAEMRGSSHPALARSYTRLRRLKPGRVIRALPHSSARPDAHRIVWKLEHTSSNHGPNK